MPDLDILLPHQLCSGCLRTFPSHQSQAAYDDIPNIHIVLRIFNHPIAIGFDLSLLLFAKTFHSFSES